MAKIKDILDIMRTVFPQENYYNKEYDNIGLLVGSQKGETDIVICCLDISKEVVAEAVAMGAKLIISHHPLIYSPLSSVTDQSTKGEIIIQLIKNDIAAYSAHTNMDFSFRGINRYVATKLGLTSLKVMDAYIDHQQGFGIVGELEQELLASQFLSKVRGFGDDRAALYGSNKKVKTVAVINGGGGGDSKHVDMALSSKADCLVTGDIKHHVALYAQQNDLALIELQHYICESAFLPELCNILNTYARDKNLQFNAVVSKRESNPCIKFS